MDFFLALLALRGGFAALFVFLFGGMVACWFIRQKTFAEGLLSSNNTHRKDNRLDGIRCDTGARTRNGDAHKGRSVPNDDGKDTRFPRGHLRQRV